MSVSGDDSGDVCAVTVCVVGAGISRHEALAIDHARRLHICGLKVIVLIDAAIDDCNADSSSVYAPVLTGNGIVHGLREVIPR